MHGMNHPDGVSTEERVARGARADEATMRESRGLASSRMGMLRARWRVTPLRRLALLLRVDGEGAWYARHRREISREETSAERQWSSQELIVVFSLVEPSGSVASKYSRSGDPRRAPRLCLSCEVLCAGHCRHARPTASRARRWLLGPDGGADLLAVLAEHFVTRDFARSSSVSRAMASTSPRMSNDAARVLASR